MTGRLVVLSGPSGVGKDTVLNRWQERNPRVSRVVACTTRPPRTGEVDGVDYTFLSREEFLQRAAEGAFLEFKEVHGNFYATPLAAMEQMLSEGRIVVLKIDVQGALDVMKLRPDAVTILLLPPSQEECERRIRARATDSDEVILRRLENMRFELAQAPHYQHTVVNDDLERCVDEIEALIA
ncbi:MAG TPA: guanylate kinase [Fimbriimonadaceae bacterium]|nr:guanylate kinase [Fimbriimonadaceae bacterium]HRJ32508.1 guanylate kinase [Fimbriimonadaceae bacterium]